jgi:hypothetical protein
MPHNKYAIPPSKTEMYSEEFKTRYWEAINNDPKYSELKAGWLQFSKILADVCLRQRTQSGAKTDYIAGD